MAPSRWRPPSPASSSPGRRVLVLGLDPMAMGVMLLVAFLVGRLRLIGDESTTVATTAIVVLATNAVSQENLLWSRLLDSCVGVVIGLLVNLAVWPPLRDRAAWSHASRLPRALGELLCPDRGGRRTGLRPRQRRGLAAPGAGGRRTHRRVVGAAAAGPGERPVQPPAAGPPRARPRAGGGAAPARAGGRRDPEHGAHDRDQRRPGPLLGPGLPEPLVRDAGRHRRGRRRRGRRTPPGAPHRAAAAHRRPVDGRGWPATSGTSTAA